MIDDSCKSTDDKVMQNKKSVVYDSEIFDSEGNDQKKIYQTTKIMSKFNKKEFILKKKRKMKSRREKRRLTEDGSSQSSKKIKLESTIQEEQTMKPEVSSIEIRNNDDQPVVIVNEKSEFIPENSIEFKQSEEIKPIPLSSIDLSQSESFEIKQNSTEFSSQFLIDESPEKTLIGIDQPPTINSNVSIQIDKPILSLPSETTKSSYFSTPLHLFSQMLTPDSNVFTPSHQHFPYPLFVPPPPGKENSSLAIRIFYSSDLDSPPLSTRTRLASNCSSIIGNSFPNSVLSEQQYCYDQESRR